MKPPWQVPCQLVMRSVTTMREGRAARLDRDEFHAKRAAGGVGRPHGVGAGGSNSDSVHQPFPLRPVNLGLRFSMKARTPSA